MSIVPNTIIIESNKKSATEQEFESFKDGVINTDSMPIDRSSSWKSYIESGIALEEGDKISIESSQINITGDPNSTMEFTRGQSAMGKDPLVDNRTAINLGYYITNKHQNNMPLPLYTHTTNRSITSYLYGQPDVSGIIALADNVPLMAIEGCRYNPDYSAAGAGDNPPPTSPYDVASWYLGFGAQDHTKWLNQGSSLYLPWMQWVGAAPLQNGPYELYKPNEMRLYKHAYQNPDDKTNQGDFSYYAPGYINLTTLKTDSPYFDLTSNFIDVEIPEGFATPASVGEFITSSFSELKNTTTKSKLYKDNENDAPTPSLFRFEGVFTTQGTEAAQKPFIDPTATTPEPQILERYTVPDKINKTWTTARTPAGTLLEDVLAGRYDGDIQFPFTAENTDAATKNMRYFFSDMLDGDVKQTAFAIKFKNGLGVDRDPALGGFRSTALILNNNLHHYANEQITDTGTDINVAGLPAPGIMPLFGQQVVLMENLPCEQLVYKLGGLPSPKFWINNSAQREAILRADTPTVTAVTPPAIPLATYDVAVTPPDQPWKTCPPIAAEGLKCLKMNPFTLIPTNIVATRGSISNLARAFNTGQYVQSNDALDEFYETNPIYGIKQNSLLRRRAHSNINITERLVTKWQVGRADDEVCVTKGYYSTLQVNMVAPVMATYYTLPQYNPQVPDPDLPSGMQMVNEGHLNQSYAAPGSYNFSSPQLPGIQNPMPDYAKNNVPGADSTIGKMTDAIDYFFDEFKTITPAGTYLYKANTYPRLLGRAWWNDNVLDNCKIIDRVRSDAFPTEGKNPGIDVASQKKGDDAKYHIEVKTTWDNRLDPSNLETFRCQLLGKDGTEATSHFRFGHGEAGDKFFDVKLLQGNVIKASFPEMTDEELSPIEKEGLGVVVVYYKPECIDPASPLFLGVDFISGVVNANGENFTDIPYIAVVNMSLLTAGNDLPNNTDLLDPDYRQIPVPVIGEMFAPSLSCQDNKWSKIINTQKVQPNMRCSPIPDPQAAPAAGKAVDELTSPPGTAALARFRTNENYPNPNVYTYPSFQSAPPPPGIGLEIGAAQNPFAYRMCDYVPYIRMGADNASISFDDNFGRFAITDFHTPFYSGNKVNPYWVRTNSDGGSLNATAQSNYAKANENFDDKIKSENRFCAAISAYVGVRGMTMERCYNFAENLATGWQFTQNAPCVPFSQIQSSSDYLPMQNSLSGIGLLNMAVPYRSIRNGPNPPTVNKQNILNLVDQVNNNKGLQNISDVDLNQCGWKLLTPYKPVQFRETLFGKMGYSLEQLLPLFGKQQNIFNRNNYNLYEGYEKGIRDKSENMVVPFTTNCFISGSNSIDFTTNFSNMPMKNLGIAREGISIAATAESDSLVATSLPSKLAYSYLVVYSDILQQQSTYYGSSHLSTLPAIGYITRNYESSDFFFSFANTWEFYVDKKRMLNEFTIDIRLPNGLKPPIDDNSSILFKIVKKKVIGILKADNNDT